MTRFGQAGNNEYLNGVGEQNNNNMLRGNVYTSSSGFKKQDALVFYNMIILPKHNEPFSLDTHS